jgi:hypothetical protein
VRSWIFPDCLREQRKERERTERGQREDRERTEREQRENRERTEREQRETSRTSRHRRTFTLEIKILDTCVA